MPVAVIPVSSFDDVTTVADDDPASEAAFKVAIQKLTNRTEFLNNNLGVGPALAVNEVFARRSTGIAEGKAASDIGLDIIALATAVLAGDAVDTKGGDLASAGLTNIAGASGKFVHITGTTTITGFGTTGAGVHRYLRFAGILTLTHNATSLILPGGNDITTAADDTCIVVSEGSGNWRMIAYQSAVIDHDATALRGVNLDNATVGSPSTGSVIYYNGVSYVATGGVVTDGVLLDNEGIQWALIVNDNVDAAAAIAGSKIDPDFGAQEVITTNNVTASGFNHATLVEFKIAGTREVALTAAVMQLSLPLLQFAVGEVAPKINQEDETTNSVNGDTFLIHAQNSTGTTANGGPLLLKGGTGTATGGNATLQGGVGSVNDGETVLLSADGTAAIGLDKDGDVSITPSSGRTIDSGAGGTAWTHQGDLFFDAAETDPKIQVVAVVDAVGTSFSVLGQSNNSAGSAAGDLLVAPGANAGAGDDGTLTLGLGVTLFETDGVDSIAFFGGSVTTKPEVTGSAGSNAALISLLTALESLNLILDSSS